MKRTTQQRVRAERRIRRFKDGHRWQLRPGHRAGHSRKFQREFNVRRCQKWVRVVAEQLALVFLETIVFVFVHHHSVIVGTIAGRAHLLRFLRREEEGAAVGLMSTSAVG